MNLEAIQLLERLDKLISMKATGTPSELAKKLGVSKRCLHDYIAFMKALNAPVFFCRIRKCYYYKEDGRLLFGFIKEK